MNKILCYKGEFPYKEFLFPAGEIGIKLNTNFASYWGANYPFTIVSRIQKSQDMVSLGLIKDALSVYTDKFYLFLPYVPYARQDRVCDKGESFSLKFFAEYINWLGFDSVTIVDPHSDVCPALLNNVSVISQLSIVQKFTELSDRLTNCVLISPDAGANKKTAKIASYFGHQSFVRADKLRNLQDGKILETIVYCDDFKGRDVAVVDDLVDGGKTFTELAQVVKKRNCGKFVLFATHGIFSKGYDVLFENGIDEIYTTNSYQETFDPRVKVFNVEPK